MAPAQENLAAVLFKANDLRVIKKDVPTPGEEDVVVKIGPVGICGSDISFVAKGKLGDLVVTEPTGLGHEAAGIVVECGTKVTNLKPGDRVSLAPNIPCRRCFHCISGRFNLCPKIPPSFVTLDRGSISQFFRHPASLCYKLPDHVSLEEGAFLEPLACAIHSVRRSGTTLGSRVFISGAGPIGLLCMMVARNMGAVNICVCDVNESRLLVAKKLGADSVLHITASSSEAQLVSAVQEKMHGLQPNVSLECSGAEAAIRLAIQATESGGVVALVGLGPSEVKVPLVDAAIREVDIRGVFCCLADFEAALALVESGNADVKALISHRFPIVEAPKAFETARNSGVTGAMKVLINCD
ncbi:Alcohol dehydrogenase N-terminal [Trinorchestia longiramus]|nr:Alcohol dehydrogenase N-terminal [Trinorchestia longiramus]